VGDQILWHQLLFMTRDGAIWITVLVTSALPNRLASYEFHL